MPDEAVRKTSAAVMTPAAPVVKLPLVVPTVKLVAAPDAPEIFVATPLLMFTN